MRAGRPAFVARALDRAVVERVLEEGAEDFRLDHFPIEFRGLAELDELEVLEF